MNDVGLGGIWVDGKWLDGVWREGIVQLMELWVAVALVGRLLGRRGRARLQMWHRRRACEPAMEQQFTRHS